MAIISRPIVEYKEIITSTGISVDDYTPPKKTMKRFIRLLKEMEDTRVKTMIDYPLYEIVIIAFLAVLSGASTWDEISFFGNARIKWLCKFLKLKNGVPSHDTFRRVFSLINPEQLQKATVLFLMENMEKIRKSLKINNNSKRHICVDGKEQKGTGRKYGSDSEIRNLQTLHIYDASNGICLFSQPIDEKTNEIPTAQEILKNMQLKDSIVTFDALHTQKKTIEIITEQKGDYVGALKGNHEVFAREVADYFTEEHLRKTKEDGTYYYKSIDKAHSQIETRRFYLSTTTDWFADKKYWKRLKGFVCYEKTVYNTITGKQTKETRYYITSLNDVELCAEAIRGHWSVENQLHWHLDANFNEDDNTTTDKNAFNNLSMLNKLSLSLLKLAQPLMKKKNSIRLMRKCFGWDTEDHVAMILNTFDDETLRNALENAKK
ncbi:MAG TPA: ISAs1 family transposase [Ruminiclostridium sp.]